MSSEAPVEAFASRKIASLAGFILRSLDRLVVCLTAVDARWRWRGTGHP